MSLRATFCFTIVEKVGLQSLSQIISKAITVAETTQNFNQFCVYVEESSVQPSTIQVPTREAIGSHEGRISLVGLEQIKSWLTGKRQSEERARTQPGHTSYQPPSILATNTCVVVIGSRAFCAVVARVHMEEISSLRFKLFNILEGLCSLKSYSEKVKISHEDVLITSVRADDKDYITYNLNWMANTVKQSAERYSHESVMDRLR